MEIREECIQGLQTIAQVLQELTGEESHAGVILLEAISQARIVILHYEHQVDTQGKSDKLVSFCKAKLQVAKREARTGELVHALWLTRTVISCFLDNPAVDSATGLT